MAAGAATDASGGVRASAGGAVRGGWEAPHRAGDKSLDIGGRPGRNADRTTIAATTPAPHTGVFPWRVALGFRLRPGSGGLAEALCAEAVSPGNLDRPSAAL